jgi:hypothetical protein
LEFEVIVDLLDGALVRNRPANLNVPSPRLRRAGVAIASGISVSYFCAKVSEAVEITNWRPNE